MVKKMSSDEIIGRANPHTVKKFELIEKYVKAWAQKLLNNQYCNGIVFIDCMSNSGEYLDGNGVKIFGTPVRVAEYLRKVAGQYPNKSISLYFSDLSSQKTNHLQSLMPDEKNNFHYHISTENGNDLLKRIGKSLENDKHYLLIYDPFQATIDWDAIIPYINNWCEIIINHMVSDSIRAIKTAKTEEAIGKYEQTYLTDLANLIPYGSDKAAYEKRIEEIIRDLRIGNRKYYISSFPFFNQKNAIVYDLIHCTGNINGFRLFKKCAWQTFDGKSSTKKTRGNENQLMFNLDGGGNFYAPTDEYCYYIKDIAEFLQTHFNGMSRVPINDVWKLLYSHPIFPSDGFKQQIKKKLNQLYGAKICKCTIDFADSNRRL